ncbi:MAG TPA: OmpH family outer membrane protein [Vicinamibacterales bacterium]|jgi:Skp family chaperone for outer membrane proteins
MPKYAFSALVLSLVLPSIAAAQSAQSLNVDAIRLAYVSPQRAFSESNDGKAARAKLDSLQSEKSREAEARNARLKALQQELAQRSSVLAENARREREQEIDRFQLNLQRFMEDAQAEFLGVRRDLENAFLAKFAPAVDSVARKRGLLFVLNQDSGVLAWADPSFDITPDVVALVNQPKP